MTTTNENGEFKPRLLVPVGESIIVHYSGKVPKASKREFNGQPIWEVNFWFGIVDKAYPDLIGQYHPLILRAWISPPRTIEAKDDEPAKTIQASKLYKLLQTIAGQEVADKFANHDASITEAEIAAEEDASKREWLKGRFVDPEWWKELRGFYVAIFKEPRKDKETKEVIYRDGGVFWQEVSELRPLKAARIMTEEDLQKSIVWPLPKPGVGQPKPAGNAAPAKQEAEPAAAPKDEPKKVAEPTKERHIPEHDSLTLQERLVRIKAFLDQKGDYSMVARGYLLKKGAEKVSTMDEESIKHLLVLLQIAEHNRRNEHMHGLVMNHLSTRKCQLHELEPADSVLLLLALDKAWSDDVPF